jgi:hypothetical protein
MLLPWRWPLWGRTGRGSQRYTRRGLKQLFHQYVEHRVHKRHLRRADVPHLWRLLPTYTLERMIGRMLIVKAFKPLSSALHVSLAA